MFKLKNMRIIVNILNKWVRENMKVKGLKEKLVIKIDSDIQLGFLAKEIITFKI